MALNSIRLSWFQRRFSAWLAGGGVSANAPRLLVVVSGSLIAGALLLVAGISVHMIFGGNLLQQQAVELDLRDFAEWQNPGSVPLRHVLHLDFPEHLTSRQHQRVTLELAGPIQRGRFLVGWVSHESERRPKVIRLEPVSDTVYAAILDRESGWSAAPVQWFLIFEGAPAAAADLLRIALDSPERSWGGVWRAAWLYWSARDGWSGRGWPGYSVDQIGVPDRGPPLTLVLVVAVWTVLSLLILGLWFRFSRQPWTWLPLIALGFVAWLILDIRWQVDLLSQLNATRTEFSGLTTLEKRLVSTDGRIVGFVEAVRERVDELPGRLFIVAERDHNYAALRSKNYLLPLNAETMLPASSLLAEGDYLMVFSAAERLSVHGHGREALRDGLALVQAPDSTTVLLRWQGGGDSRVAERVLIFPEGQLFRVH